jgi:hypothetical protein
MDMLRNLVARAVMAAGSIVVIVATVGAGVKWS